MRHNNDNNDDACVPNINHIVLFYVLTQSLVLVFSALFFAHGSCPHEKNNTEKQGIGRQNMLKT